MLLTVAVPGGFVLGNLFGRIDMDHFGFDMEIVFLASKLDNQRLEAWSDGEKERNAVTTQISAPNGEKMGLGRDLARLILLRNIENQAVSFMPKVPPFGVLFVGAYLRQNRINGQANGLLHRENLDLTNPGTVFL